MINEELINEDELTELTMTPSLILFSGGVDSTVLLYYLVSEKIPVKVIAFDYGQKAKKELECMKNTCEKLHVSYEIFDISSLNIIGSVENKENPNDLVISNRNAIFLTIASNYAIRNNISTIYYGASEVNVPSYCDTTPEFVESINNLFNVSDLRPVTVKAPFIFMTKEEVIDIGLNLNVPLEETWFCSERNDAPCGECAGCNSTIETLNKMKQILLKELENVQSSLDTFSKQDKQDIISDEQLNKALTSLKEMYKKNLPNTLTFTPQSQTNTTTTNSRRG